MPATKTNGKVCYMEIPAVDIERSSSFYAAVFGWNLRRRSDGATGFDDGVGEVSGWWVKGRPPSRDAGIQIYVMVDSVAQALASVVAEGGEVVQPIGADPGVITARFRDPAGNLVGLYQDS